MTTQEVGREIGRHLARIAEILPADYRLTLVCRNAGRPDADLVLGDDEPEEAIRAIANLKEADAEHIDIRVMGGR